MYIYHRYYNVSLTFSYVYSMRIIVFFNTDYYRLNESEFMEFSDIENHDDFYLLDEGRVHVQDQRGYYVVYDAAVDDLK